jgi:SAM-dependent methyltransferase
MPLSPWWTSRSGALAAVDPAFAGLVDAHAEAQVDLIDRLCELPPGGRVLDLGCGGGRHSILLQERGHAVVGVDLSQEIVALAQENWETRNPGVDGPQFVVGDMRAPPVQGSFSVVLLMDASLGVFDDDAEHLRVLTAAADRLEPGGSLVIELLNPYFWAHRNLTQHFPPGSVAANADILRSYRFDPLVGRVQDRITIFEDGARRVLPTQSLRCWTPPEIAGLSSAAGFSQVNIIGSDGWQVPNGPGRLDPESSATIWVLARL